MVSLFSANHGRLNEFVGVGRLPFAITQRICKKQGSASCTWPTVKQGGRSLVLNCLLEAMNGEMKLHSLDFRLAE
jgi:hypothetical protein